MRKILFVCEHNSARSIMAEAYLNHLADAERLKADSAGLEPGLINPYVIDVMKEDGIDLSAKSPQSVFELYRRGSQYDAVITVCSPEVGKRCPLFPGRVLRRNWPFADPSAVVGTDDEKRSSVREIRDQIKAQVRSFIQEFNDRGFTLFIETES